MYRFLYGFGFGVWATLIFCGLVANFDVPSGFAKYEQSSQVTRVYSVAKDGNDYYLFKRNNEIYMVKKDSAKPLDK